jgi:hypothetical protein
MAYYFTERKTKKKYTIHQLALLLHKEGNNIMYSDIEGVAIMIDDDGEKQYYIIDECGYAVWIDYERFYINEGI